MSTETAAAIRADLKARGWTARTVSVRNESYSMGSTVHVTIKDPDVPLATVAELARAHEHVHYCESTGEVLCGGNTHVSVSYDRAAIRPVAEAILARLSDEPGRAVEVGKGWQCARENPGWVTDEYRYWYGENDTGRVALSKESAAWAVARAMLSTVEDR
jgi:hypothetical protein